MPNLVVYRSGAAGIVTASCHDLHKSLGPGFNIPVCSLVLVDILAQFWRRRVTRN